MTPEQVRRLYRKQKSVSKAVPVTNKRTTKTRTKKRRGCGCGK